MIPPHDKPRNAKKNEITFGGTEKHTLLTTEERMTQPAAMLLSIELPENDKLPYDCAPIQPI